MKIDVSIYATQFIGWMPLKDEDGCSRKGGTLELARGGGFMA